VGLERSEMELPDRVAPNQSSPRKSPDASPPRPPKEWTGMIIDLIAKVSDCQCIAYSTEKAASKRNGWFTSVIESSMRSGVGSSEGIEFFVFGGELGVPFEDDMVLDGFRVCEFSDGNVGHPITDVPFSSARIEGSANDCNNLGC
jgi:hypothetical protein